MLDHAEVRHQIKRKNTALQASEIQALQRQKNQTPFYENETAKGFAEMAKEIFLSPSRFLRNGVRFSCFCNAVCGGLRQWRQGAGVF